MPNFTVNWTNDKGALSADSSSTDANGLATVTLKHNVAEAAQVTAQAGNSSNINAPVINFTADGASATIGSGDLTVDKTTVVANNVEVVTYTALVKDAGGNPVPNIAVAWTTDNGTLSAATTNTDATGKATVTLTSTLAGNAQVTGSVNGTAPVNASLVLFIADTTTVSIGAGDLTVDKTTIVANDTDVATYTALVKDANGNPVSNFSVSWATDYGTLSGTTSNTSTDGKAIITLKGTTIGLATVKATVNGTANPADRVTLIADAATAKIKASNISVDKARIISDGVESALYTLKVTDAYDNPVPAIAVNFATKLGDLVPATSNTDNNGQITARLTANIPGGPSTPDSQANVNAQVNSSVPVNAPSVALVIPAQHYTGPQISFDTQESPKSSSFVVSGRTGTISGDIKVRVKTNYTNPDILWYTLTAPGGRTFELKKQADGQTGIGDKTFTIDASGISKAGTWKMAQDAVGPGTAVYTLDWDVVL